MEPTSTPATGDIGAEVERLRLAVRLVQQLGHAYRGDWMDFDGRTLRDQVDDLSEVVHGRMTAARYRSLNGLCPHGGGHWDEYCKDYCAADFGGGHDAD